MFLLPGAERYRRVLLAGAAVGLLGVQAVFMQPQVESTVSQILAPVQKPLAGLAGFLDGLLTAGASTDHGAETAPTASALVAIERRLGLPEVIPGMAWLEVPVWSLDLERGRLVIAAGADFHLAEGQVVAFGDAFLGRLGEVREHSADVELWTAAGLRTGLSVTSDVMLPLRAVCFGRGTGGAAVVEWSEDETGHADGRLLMWRPRPLDPPILEQSGLRLGVLRQEGDPSRGEASWVVEHAIPAGAHGRVFIAAGAVGSTLIAEPAQRKQSATRLLPTDAILGSDWYALAADTDFAPTVSTDQGKVSGEVRVWRGQWGWARRLSPAAWEDRAVALHLEENAVLGAEAWMAFELPLPLFTRGGADLPRGLWIGYQDEAAPQPGAALEVLRLDAQSEKPQ
ncbi:MAG: hypothetical protein O3A95_00385 [Planctomycetota bacterium]|nr:hypothetical protein [Planctomycetota bacterium]MDA1112747.1 hypothetical protein [Planctomycetota bacterium]